MGCGSSGALSKSSGARLMTTKLNFTPEQLDSLNGFFRKSVERSGAITRDSIDVEATVERLLQRLVAGIANLDPKFSSMFLISLNERRRIKQMKFEYMLRIDALSSPVIDPSLNSAGVIVEEDSTLPGFVRLRVRGSSFEYWSEFLDSDGRLKRDLVKAKVVNLLAAATKQESMKGTSERICQSPGQIVDAATLDKILKQPDYCRIFYATGDLEKELPEPRDHRVVLVEDSSGILLRIGLNAKKNADIEVRIFIGIGIEGWSTLADYPLRIHLYHCDALLHYTAAQSGMYAVAVGPNAGTRCEDRGTLWRVRVPAAETIMNQHYSEESVPALTESVLMYILDQLYGRVPLNIPMKKKENLKVVSRYIVKTICWWSLERTGPDPLRSWSPDSLSRHVIHALDELVMALKCQNLRCYFYPRCNVMLHSAKDGILYPDEAYESDARVIEEYLTALNQYSLLLMASVPGPNDQLENELILRWQRVMVSLPRGTMSTYTGYNPRQLSYLALVIKEVLNVKDLSTNEGFNNTSCCLVLSALGDCPRESSEPIDNLVYLITLILRQAREQIFTSRKKFKKYVNTSSSSSSSGSSTFERSLDILVETIRHDRDTAYSDLDDEIIMTRILLKWLYFGMDNDKKILGPILRPYLGNLFNSSHENAWHVESWKKRRDIFNTEMNSLSLFCKLVTSQEITPASGIVDAISKGWTWAEHTTKIIEQFGNGMRLVFLPSNRVLKYSLTFSRNNDHCKRGVGGFSSWSKARNIGSAMRQASITRTNMITAGDTFHKLNFSDFEGKNYKGFSCHAELRDSSPLTHVVLMNHRRGRQRGPGGLVPALVALNKFRILQEAAAVLPHEERILMLDAIQKVAREASRRQRKNSCPDLTASAEPRQIYRPRSENELAKSSPVLKRKKDNNNSVLPEREKQLHKEIMEIHDTLTRGLRPSKINEWDSSSVLSWTSSIRSIGRNKRRRACAPIWETRGTLPMWDRVGSDGNLVNNSEIKEMMSREESPKWSFYSTIPRQFHESGDSGDDEILPSWDFLDTTLNQKLLHYTCLDSDKK